MNLIEKQTASDLLYDGKVVTLYKDTVELPDGASAIREYVKHIGAVCVVPVTDNGEVILERQYRYAVGEILVEIPAGKLDFPGENWESAARRELREETGAEARELIDLGDYYGSPAIMGERIRMFLARGLTFTNQHLDDDEFLEVFRLPLDEAVRQIMAGEIPDGKTQAGILRAAMMLKK
ncbi:MAG: NUDIX hydrolase [Clostridia bacterium]|nr:NUDIX hydrolase [Clostridia bacterium]